MHAPSAPRPTPPAEADKNPLTWNLIKVCPECAGRVLRADLADSAAS